MNVSTMRRIDGAAGPVACRVLTMHRRILGRMTPPEPGEARRILFVKLAEQGTTVLAAGTIRMAVDKVASARCANLVGRTTLREFPALCSIAQILIASDCGPTHFAGMTPVNTIALFGPETLALFGPLLPRCRVLQGGLECSPCFSVFNGRTSDCRDNLCLKRISVDEVEAAVVEILESKRRRDAC